jgi:hypothetical protein
MIPRAMRVSLLEAVQNPLSLDTLRSSAVTVPRPSIGRDSVDLPRLLYITVTEGDMGVGTAMTSKLAHGRRDAHKS